MWRKLLLWPLALAAAVGAAMLFSWMVDAFDVVEAFRAGRPTASMAIGVLGLVLTGVGGFDLVRSTIRAALRA